MKMQSQWYICYVDNFMETPPNNKVTDMEKKGVIEMEEYSLNYASSDTQTSF